MNLSRLLVVPLFALILFGCSQQDSTTTAASQNNKWSIGRLEQEKHACEVTFLQTRNASFAAQTGKEFPKEIATTYCGCVFSHLASRWGPAELSSSSDAIIKTLTEEGIPEKCNDAALLSYADKINSKKLNNTESASWMAPKLQKKCMDSFHAPELADNEKTNICNCAGKRMAEYISLHQADDPNQFKIEIAKCGVKQL